MRTRSSGILLHITSLPGPYGIGDLGSAAYRFADFLGSCSQSYWQILPLNPTGTYLGNSPYTSYSVFAGNPLLISPEMLAAEGLLSAAEIENPPAFPQYQADYSGAIEYKRPLLRMAFEQFKSGMSHNSEFEKFCAENAHWLEDFTLFASLKDKFDEVAWYEWPAEIRDRNEKSLVDYRMELADRILMSKFFQFIFFKQWSAFKAYCNSKKIRIIGDIPIYPSIDSSDAWAHPEIFKLDAEKQPVFVAGAPPDYFSATGQRWGNPVYRWDYLKETNYAWWIHRIDHNLKLFDMVRLDHFRGFVAYWEIPADEETAVNGKWVSVPAMEFFEKVVQSHPQAPIIVEDLGLITPDVKEVMDHFHFPGMKVLLFAFGGDLPTNPYAPHNYTKNCVVYTGTHDNNTIRGWFDTEATVEDKERLFQYLGRNAQGSEIPWELIRLALGSVADFAIIPMQDVLGLGQEARMNLPSQSQRNWNWRLTSNQLTQEIAERLARMTHLYGRS